jgi:hypothetical protein
MEIFASSQIIKGILDDLGAAEAEGTHREGKPFSVIDIGRPSRMGILIQNEDPFPSSDKVGCCRQSADPSAYDNCIPGFRHMGNIAYDVIGNKETRYCKTRTVVWQIK